MLSDFNKFVSDIIARPSTEIVLSHKNDLDVNNNSDLYFCEKSGLVTLKKFKSCLEYVLSRFPDADIADVKAFIISGDFVKKTFLEYAGGCYIPSLKCILLKSFNSKIKRKHKIDKLLDLHCANVPVDDIFVHELIHAVSHSYNRYTRISKHLEEDFVYTNTIDWLCSKGLSDDDIVLNNFLPFIISDYVKKKDLDSFLLSLNSEYCLKNKPQIIDENALAVSEHIVKIAKEIGMNMIKNHRKYGVKNKLSYNNSDIAPLDFG